jgi:hypothetical protein
VICLIAFFFVIPTGAAFFGGAVEGIIAKRFAWERRDEELLGLHIMTRRTKTLYIASPMTSSGAVTSTRRSPSRALSASGRVDQIAARRCDLIGSWSKRWYRGSSPPDLRER